MNVRKNRRINIDVLKGLGILSVILLHTYNGEFLLKVGAPFHIWQAVPVFIILQGFNQANSYLRRDFKQLEDFKDKKYMLRKFKRLIFPFLIFFIIQTAFLWFDTPDYFMEQNHLFRLLTGGRGPGSYFIPLTIQAQIILPVIYLAVQKNVKGMLIGSGIVTTILEVMSAIFNINEDFYRILIIRFIFALALGVALAFWKNKKFRQPIIYFLFAISVIYIYGVMYFDWHFIMEHFWHSQHLPGFFYPLALIIILLRIPMSENHLVLRLLSKMGRASYHIFFVQILYFWEPIRNLRPDMLRVPATIINVAICSIIGLLFYHFEQFIWEKNEN